jgi:hypothetical protein
MPKGTPVDPEKKERYAELIGVGLTHIEASRVTGISTRLGERLMSRPEYRKIADDVKGGRRLRSGVEQEIRDLLTATNPDGTPNLVLRLKGLEMWVELEGEADPLPPGVRAVIPVPPDQREGNKSGAGGH